MKIVFLSLILRPTKATNMLMEKQTPSAYYYPTIFQGFGILLLFILLSMLSGLVISLGYLTGSEPWIDFIEMLGYVLAAGGTLLWIVRLKMRVYFEKPTFRHKQAPSYVYLLAVVLTLLAIVVIDPLTELIPMPESIRDMFERMFSKTVPAFFTAVIVAPVLEELIFRGIVLEGFLKNYSPLKAILWTNVLFGLAHLNPWQFIGAFLMGILISWVYYKTRNLILPVAMHLLNNLISYLFLYLSDVPFSQASLKDIFPSPSLYYGLIAGAALLLVLFFVYSSRLIPEKLNEK